MSLDRIALSWNIGHLHGWGIYGLNLVFAMLRRNVQPLLPHAPGRLELDPLRMNLLLPSLEQTRQFLQLRQRHPDRRLAVGDALLLLSSDGHFRFFDGGIQADRRAGVTFFNSVELDKRNIAAASELPLILTGSTWNERILKERYGLNNVVNVLQGVDTTLFFPSAKRQIFPGRFVIFSGGKLEFRKGQDLVLAIFKRFHERHPEALLLTAWFNLWEENRSRFPDRHVQGMPAQGEALSPWLGRHLPRDSFVDVGAVPNPFMPSIVREADVALFANRCEGGTNLVAMECLAAGLPVILSDNTGHRDLIDDRRCYRLGDQGPVVDPESGALLEDWGESSVDEGVERLEEVYRNRQAAAQRGARAHAFMRDYSWERQCDRVLDRLQAVCQTAGFD